MTKQFKTFLDWYKENSDWAWELPAVDDSGKSKSITVAEDEFWKVTDNNRENVTNELSSLKTDDLKYVDGFFDKIYAKWSDRKMGKFIDSLYKKIGVSN